MRDVFTEDRRGWTSRFDALASLETSDKTLGCAYSPPSLEPPALGFGSDEPLSTTRSRVITRVRRGRSKERR